MPVETDTLGGEETGVRLNKYLAHCGIASRRKCDEIIFDGKVKVNNVVVTTPGVQIDETEDTVRVEGIAIKAVSKKSYIMLNKPSGYVSTCSDPKNRKTVLDLLDGVDDRVYPVGRLDYDTQGLLLLTNDGDLAYRITHPKHKIDKRYTVKINSGITFEEMEKLKNGVFIDGGYTSYAGVDVIRVEPDQTVLSLTIHEGKNRQIRKMFQVINKEVTALKREAIGDLTLGKLKRGEYRELTEEEVTYLKNL